MSHGENVILTYEDLKQQILVSFGGPSQCVELTDLQISVIVKMTRRWWVSYVGGVQKLQGFYYGSEQATLQLPLEVEEVVDVFFQNRLPLQFDYPELFDTAVPWPGAFSTIIGGPTISASLGNMPYSGLLQSLQAIEQSRKILSADRDYEFDKRTKILTLYPRAAEAGRVLVKYLGNAFELEELTADEAQIFFEWAKAEAMEILGRLRSKYSSFPVPGGERTLDGATLLEDSKAEKERLRKEVIDKFKTGMFSAE